MSWTLSSKYVGYSSSSSGAGGGGGGGGVLSIADDPSPLIPLEDAYDELLRIILDNNNNNNNNINININNTSINDNININNNINNNTNTIININNNNINNNMNIYTHNLRSFIISFDYMTLPISLRPKALEVVAQALLLEPKTPADCLRSYDLRPRAQPLLDFLTMGVTDCKYEVRRGEQ